MTAIKFVKDEKDGTREVALLDGRPIADIIPDRGGLGGGWVWMAENGRSGFWFPRWVESRADAKAMIEKRFLREAAMS